LWIIDGVAVAPFGTVVPGGEIITFDPFDRPPGVDGIVPFKCWAWDEWVAIL